MIHTPAGEIRVRSNGDNTFGATEFTFEDARRIVIQRRRPCCCSYDDHIIIVRAGPRTSE
jgi:hypothetical protein